MSIIEQTREHDDRLKKLEETIEMKGKKKKKGIKIKIPGFLSRAIKNDPNVSLALWLGANHEAEFKKAIYKEGLIYVGEQSYMYEEGSIYRLKIGKKRLPFLVVFEWRLMPVGGKVEEYHNRVLNGEDAEETAKKLGVTNQAQLTIIRRLEQEEAEIGKKKKGGFNMIVLYLVLAALVLYVIAKAFGG